MWVSYQEAIVTKNKDINVMKITAPTTQATIHPLYFDLLRFASEVRRQSRDKVVPPIDPNLYSNNNFWQQTYRWSQVCLNMFVLNCISNEIKMKWDLAVHILQGGSSCPLFPSGIGI